MINIVNYQEKGNVGGEKHNSHLKKHVDKDKDLMYSIDFDGREESQTNMENNDKKNIYNLKGKNNSKTNDNMRFRTYQMFVHKNLETMVEKHRNYDSEGQQSKTIVSSSTTNIKPHNYE